MPNLSERASQVLYAVVTEFIATGQPMGSRTLTTRYGFDLSAATIRNVLADLEDEGYLTQPHTSAGRLPTERALRFFIDELMSHKQVRAEDAERIRSLFAGPKAPSARMREAGRLLSELSGVPAVIVAARSETRHLVKVRFIPTGGGQLLSVLVLDDGTVENRFITLEAPIDQGQLERVHNLLDAVTSGRTLRDVSQHLEEISARERAEISQLTKLSGSLLNSALVGVERAQEVIIEGRSSLLGALEDPDHLRRLLVAMEDREQLIQLLDQTLSSSDVQVFLGTDTGEEGGSPLSLVAAAYRQEDHSAAGAVGVIGPTRMDYPGLVPLVGVMAKALSRSFGYEQAQGKSEGDEAPSTAPEAGIDRGPLGS